MFLYRRGKFWWVEYRRNGKRYRVSTKCEGRMAARQFMYNLAASVGTAKYENAARVLALTFGIEEKPRKGLPLAEAWTAYENTARAIGRDGISETTRKIRARYFALFVEWARKNGAENVLDIDGTVAAAYAAHLAGLGKSPKTRKNIIGHLSTMWDALEKSVKGAANPWHNLAPRDAQGERRAAFTRDEERRVLAAALEAGHDWHAVCTVARWTGLRYGDVARLRWADIDEERGVISVVPGKTARHGVRVTVPMADAVRDALAGIERTGEWVFAEHKAKYGATNERRLRFSDVLEAARWTS